MSYKPDEKDWMAYLYGELEGKEKESMEQYLLENAEARKELEQFQALRGMMGKVEDKEVIAPPIFIGDHHGSSVWRIPYFKTILSIAASLVILILAARFTDLRIGITNNEVRFSFGGEKVEIVKPEENLAIQNTNPSALTAEEVQSMISSALKNNNAVVKEDFKESQDKLNASIQRNLAANSHKIDELMREAATASQAQVQQYVAALQAQNVTQVKDYLQLTSSEQKKYMEELLVDFAQYLQQQRNNDLQVVQLQMQSLEENTNIFKQETEQILTGIISSVNQNGPGMETKN